MNNDEKTTHKNNGKKSQEQWQNNVKQNKNTDITIQEQWQNITRRMTITKQGMTNRKRQEQ